MGSFQLPKPNLAWFLLGLSILFNVLLDFRIEITPLASGDDETRAWAATHVAMEGLNFGTDVVFTHGPLGYLTDRCPDLGYAVPVGVVASFVVDILGGLAVYLFVSGMRFPALWLNIILVWLLNVSLAVPGSHSEDGYFLVVILLALASRVHPRRFLALSLGAFLAGVCALVKLSLGIGAIVSVVVAAALAPNRKDAVRGVLTVCGVYAASVMACWLAVGQSPSHLLSYVINGYAVVQGYPFSLGMGVGGWEQMVAKYVATIVLLVTWGLWLKTKTARGFVIAFLFPTFVAFKHSVVRMGPLHILHFPAIMQMTVFALFVYALSVNKALKSLPLALGIIFLMNSAPQQTEWRSANSRSSLLNNLFEAAFVIPARSFREIETLWRLPEERNRVRLEQAQNMEKHRLPPDWLDEIGTAGTDMWSFDLIPIAANGLTYQPRPTLTTIIAASAKADDLDSEFLRSANGTPYIFMDNIIRGIGGEHNFWAEPKSYRSIFSLYNLQKRHDGLLLLKRRSSERLSPPRHIGTTKVVNDDFIGVPRVRPGELVYGEFRIPITLGEKLRDLFFKPDVFLAELKDLEGELYTLKFFPTNSHHGLLLNPLPWKDDQAIEFLRDLTGPRMTAVRFLRSSDGGSLTGFEIAWYSQELIGIPRINH